MELQTPKIDDDKIESVRGDIDRQTALTDEIADEIEPVDLSVHDCAEMAARELHRWARFRALASGMDPNFEVFMQSPNEYERDDGWRVCWESGPMDWAVALTGGSSIYNRRFNAELSSTEPEVVGFRSSDWFAEPYYGFDLVFFDK